MDGLNTGRRTLLAVVGGVTGLGAAGCLQLEEGDDESPADGSDESDSGDEDTADSEDSVSFEVAWTGTDVDGLDAFIEENDIRTNPEIRPHGVVDESVYVIGGNSGALAAINPDTRAVETRYDSETREWDGVTSTHLTDDSVYMAGPTDDGGKIVKLTPGDDLVWSRTAVNEHESVSQFAVCDEYLFACSRNRTQDTTMAFEVFDTNGDQVFVETWDEDSIVNNFRDLAVTENFVFIGELNTAYVYDIDGQELLESADLFGVEHGRHFTIEDSVLYSVGRYETKAIDLETNELLFDAEPGGVVDPVLSETSLLVGDETGLYSYDRTTGEENWHHRTTNEVSGGPVVLDGIAYALDDSDLLYAVRIDDGTVLHDGEVPFDGRTPLLSTDDSLVFTDQDGLVIVEPTVS
ncbi:outer membrane protein assembly factor BamB family protein [Natranaeroarchaeum sulfidigenes]|uniref:Secreted protein, with PKD repeat domain n=1 Tax=Natranaeroarchaeum sulfidigenes TaxID=2784880 RepID=A0A897MVM7_9EURY|nr:PQQ-binding-like beta-propeller repeat protein [Natranaeroarchaeum sulfidigenes]QSG02989.1 Secreted protein, with PKD repeat domain [Natranaeroarchaeum sulfidigenes]